MLKVPWCNEILLLKPASPESHPEDLKYNSHIKAIVTIYFAGFKEDANPKKDERWQISVFHRGAVLEDSLETDFPYESLRKKAQCGTDDGFYNELLSLSPDMRIIKPSDRDGYVKVFLSGIEDEYAIKAMKLDNEKRKNEYIKLTTNSGLPYSRFDIFGQGIEKRIIRFSYRSAVSLDKRIREGNEYTFKNNTFYAYESFRIDSPAAVIRKIEAKLADKDLTEWQRSMSERRPKRINQDFVIVGQPNGFDYNITHGATYHMNHRIAPVEWRNPGTDYKQSGTRADIFFPKEEFYTMQDSFALNVTARMLCRMCEPYYIGAKIKKTVEKSIRKEFGELEKKIKDIKDSLDG